MSSLLIMSIPVSAMTGSLDVSESETYLTEPFVPTDEEITPQLKPDQHTQGYDAEYADPDESDNALVNTISSNGFKIKVTETDIKADGVYNSGGYGTVRLSDPEYGLVDRNGEFVFSYRLTWNRYVCSEGIVAQFNDDGYFYTNGLSLMKTDGIIMGSAGP